MCCSLHQELTRNRAAIRQPCLIEVCVQVWTRYAEIRPFDSHRPTKTSTEFDRVGAYTIHKSHVGLPPVFHILSILMFTAQLIQQASCSSAEITTSTNAKSRSRIAKQRRRND